MKVTVLGTSIPFLPRSPGREDWSEGAPRQGASESKYAASSPGWVPRGGGARWYAMKCPDVRPFGDEPSLPPHQFAPVPEISRFFGIVVAMYYDDHPPPHFHVRYGEYRAILEIETVAVLFGDLPHRVLGMVVEWAALHRAELDENWS